MSKSVKFVKIVSPIALAIALTACGGGSTTFGSGGTTGDGTTQVQQVSSIELSVSSRQLASDGSAPITITAIAKDANNNAIDGADIIFSVDKDATIIKDAVVTTAADDGTTATDGSTETTITAGSVQTATLVPGLPENKTLNVTASSGLQSQSIAVDVVGTTVTIDGPQAITLNKESPFVLKLKDSSDKPIAFQTVTLTSANGNSIITDSNFQTGPEGEISFSVNGIVSGTDTLTTAVLGTSFQKSIVVSPDEFALSAASNEININTPTTISFIWKKDGIPQAGQTITLSATRGDIVSQTAVTDSTGSASFVISSSTAGQTVISATTDDGLSTTLEREFIATTPFYLNTQADPTLITPNGSSTIIAKIRDFNDNPVKNKIIDFRLQDTVDGTLSASTAVTDSLGRASVSYKAGNSSSAKDGVVINTFIQGFPAVAMDQITLTVGGNAVRIVLGDDHLLAPDNTFYVKQFGVIATDSAGNPIADQQISFSIIPTIYSKGTLWFDGTRWRQDANPPVGGITDVCPSEDFDNDGNLDAGEDINNSGVLEPTHDATVTGSGVTDENGKIVVEVVYPKNTAWWSEQRIEATTTVDGTEFIEYTEFVLPVLAEDVTGEGTPPNIVSPYGTFGSCFDSPDGTPPPTPVVYTVVDPLTGTEVIELRHNIWYSISGAGQIISDSSYSLSTSVVTIEFGPNNTFRLIDNDIAVDNSGFFITLNVNGNTKSLFYRDDVEIINSVSPVITLNGVNPTIVSFGGTFVEAGFTAIDDVDGDISGSVTVLGSVNTAILGDYTLTYQVTDSAGNVGSITRTVSVVDDIDPVVSLVGANPFLVALAGVYVEPGFSAFDSVDGNISGDVTVSGSVNTAVAGDYILTYSVTDSSGNTGSTTRTVTVTP